MEISHLLTLSKKADALTETRVLEHLHVLRQDTTFQWLVGQLATAIITKLEMHFNDDQKKSQQSAFEMQALITGLDQALYIVSESDFGLPETREEEE